MLDTFGIPSSFKGDVQIFTRPCTVTNTQFETWRKPRGVSMVNILAIAGGGGGGGGFTRAEGNAGGGGGGGGSSGIGRLTCPAWLLPDVLYIQVGAGGQGVGSGGGTAGSGVSSKVMISSHLASVNSNTLLVAVSTSNAEGGTTGTAAAVGTGGAGGGIAVIADMPLGGLGIFNSIAGQDGAAGGAVAGANGTAITIPVTSALCQGGSGGAGTTAADFAGGECTAITDSWLSQQRPATPAAGSNNGSGGPQIWKPFFSFGGLGGSSSNTGIGGAGGNGAYGAGGGGGGAGTTGGRGGDGGSGIVIITSW